jgi:WD40 repeat protein
MFASGSSDGFIRAWDSRSSHPVRSAMLPPYAQMIKEKHGHQDFVLAVECSPKDADVLFSGSKDNLVKMWNMKSM